MRVKWRDYSGINNSLQASSPFGGYSKKQTSERHARGDAKAGARGVFAARSRVLARLVLFAQTGELARTLYTQDKARKSMRGSSPFGDYREQKTRLLAG